jgi:hypothetical protein
MEQQTSNPPTPKASAWQALTCFAVAPLSGAKEERPTACPERKLNGSNAQLRDDAKREEF